MKRLAMALIITAMGASCAGDPGESTLSQPADSTTDDDTCNGDPLLFDVGDGATMSDVDHGVIFDLNAAGIVSRFAWPLHGSWLALDVNGNGRIDNGAELFGSASKAPSALASLAAYDDNGDGVIDVLDDVYHRLLLWNDKNHDGISQAGELTPASSVVEFVVLTPFGTSRTDANGNVFAFHLQGNGVVQAWAVIPATSTGTHATNATGCGHDPVITYICTAKSWGFVNPAPTTQPPSGFTIANCGPYVINGDTAEFRGTVTGTNYDAVVDAARTKVAAVWHAYRQFGVWPYQFEFWWCRESFTQMPNPFAIQCSQVGP